MTAKKDEKKTTSTQVAEKEESTQVALKTSDKSWGNQSVEAKDILIPRLYVLNALSKMSVANPKQFPAGSIITSITKTVIGDNEVGIAFIPFMFTKKWKIETKVKTQFEHARFEPYTPDNAARPWEWREDGKEFRANTVLDFFVLLKTDVDKERAALKAMEESGDLPDPDDAMFPTCISFSRTSYESGKLLTTHFTKAQSFKLNPAVTTFNLTSAVKTSADHTWHGLNVTKFGKTSNEDIVIAKHWYDILSQSTVVIDESEDEVFDAAPVAEKPVLNDNF